MNRSVHEWPRWQQPLCIVIFPALWLLWVARLPVRWSLFVLYGHSADKHTNWFDGFWYGDYDYYEGPWHRRSRECHPCRLAGRYPEGVWSL